MMTELLKFLLVPFRFYMAEESTAAPVVVETTETVATDTATEPAKEASGADTLTGKSAEEQATEDAAKAVEAEGMKVPDTPDGYKLPVPEGNDGAFAKEAAAWFHEAGIPPAQAEKLAAKWNEYAAAQAAAQGQAAVDAEKQAEARFTAETGALKKEWGDKYDANLELGRRAVKQFEVAPDILTAIEDKVGPAGLFKLFSRIGSGLGEDSVIGVTGTSKVGTTSAETLYPDHYK